MVMKCRWFYCRLYICIFLQLCEFEFEVFSTKMMSYRAFIRISKDVRPRGFSITMCVLYAKDVFVLCTKGARPLRSN